MSRSRYRCSAASSLCARAWTAVTPSSPRSEETLRCADSQPARRQGNLESLRNLAENLRAQGMAIEDTPLVLHPFEGAAEARGAHVEKAAKTVRSDGAEEGDETEDVELCRSHAMPPDGVVVNPGDGPVDPADAQAETVPGNVDGQLGYLLAGLPDSPHEIVVYTTKRPVKSFL